MRRLAAQIARCLPPPDPQTDGDLLAAFRAGSEPAFAELVRRHGPMVWGVCRRTLPDPADAEDAFQAVFVVLVRKARGLSGSGTVGPWLHRVAALTARNVRRRNARRMAKAAPLPDQLYAPATDPDLPLDLDSALLALPEKYRSPIVLCHLLGFTRAEAAVRLNCAEGTLSAWLSRGLAKLRVRLGGLDPSRTFPLIASVPVALSGATVRAAATHAAAAAVPLAVSRIAEGVIHMFWVKKATAATTALFAVFAMGVGVGLSGRQVVGIADGQEKGTAVAFAPTAADDALALKILELEFALTDIEAERLAATQTAALTELEIARLSDDDPVKVQDKIQKAKEKIAEAQKEAARAVEKAKKIKDELEKVKPAKQKPGAVEKLEAATEIEAIEQALKALKAELEKADRNPAEKRALADLARKVEELAAKRAELLKQTPDKPKPADPRAAELEKIDQAIKELAARRAELLKQTRPEPRKPLGEPEKPKAAEFDKHLTDLKAALDRTARDRDRLADQTKELERAIKELTAKHGAAGERHPQPEPRPEPRTPLGVAPDLAKKLQEAETRFAERTRLFEMQQQKARAELDALRAEIEAMRKAKPRGESVNPVEPRKPLGESVKPSPPAEFDAKLTDLKKHLDTLAAERQELDRRRDVIAEKEKALKAAAEALAARRAAEAKKARPPERR